LTYIDVIDDIAMATDAIHRIQPTAFRGWRVAISAPMTPSEPASSVNTSSAHVGMAGSSGISPVQAIDSSSMTTTTNQMTRPGQPVIRPGSRGAMTSCLIASLAG
jgi:hypothetical protein